MSLTHVSLLFFHTWFLSLSLFHSFCLSFPLGLFPSLSGSSSDATWQARATQKARSSHPFHVYVLYACVSLSVWLSLSSFVSVCLCQAFALPYRLLSLQLPLNLLRQTNLLRLLLHLLRQEEKHKEEAVLPPPPPRLLLLLQVLRPLRRLPHLLFPQATFLLLLPESEKEEEEEHQERL